MNALDYLRSVPVMFINVEGSNDRLQQFMRGTAPLFDTVYRQVAAPIADVAQDAYRWREMIRWSKSLGTSTMYDKVNVFQASDKTMERESKQREYAATFSLYRTTLAIHDYFLNKTDWDRIMIMEDDAVPRVSMLAQMGMEPPDADLRVWGGAIGMGAHNHDDKLFLRGKTPQWKRITNPRGRYIATAYEMTRVGAAENLKNLLMYPHAVDCVWWNTMATVPSYALTPTAFVQVGQSDRIKKLKEGKFER